MADRGPGWERRDGKIIFRSYGIPSAYLVSEEQLRRLQTLTFIEILVAAVTGLPIMFVIIEGIGRGMDWVLLLSLLAAFGVLNQGLWFYLRRRRLDILQGAPVAAETPRSRSVTAEIRRLWQNQSDSSLSRLTWATGAFAFMPVAAAIMKLAGVGDPEGKVDPILALLLSTGFAFAFFLCLKERRRRRRST